MISSEMKMSKQNEVLKLASHTQNVARVEPFVEQIIERYGINSEVYGNILISLTEAVTNAIIHGNHSDINKSVYIHTKKSKTEVSFLVTDEGPGFDYENLPDPTAPENLLKIGGRGVFLMKQLSDDVLFLNDGRTVEIRFNI